MTYEAFYNALLDHIADRKAKINKDMGTKNIREDELERLGKFIEDSDVGGE